MKRRIPERLRRMALLALMLPTLLVAAEPLVFDSPQLEARFDRLTEELRCVVCQNQSLADSDAPLAQDLRNEVFVMLREGRSDEEIKNFLVSRYGEFVLYRPPMRGSTLLLWLAPLLLFTGGAVVIALTLRQRRVMLAEEALQEAEQGLPAGDVDDGPQEGAQQHPDRAP